MPTRPSRTPKQHLVDERRAEHAARMAEAEAPMDVVEAVEAEMAKPANRNLAGAARSAKRRSEVEARSPNERAARAAERAIEAREQARAAKAAREGGEAEWEAFRGAERAERQRGQAVSIAKRLDMAFGTVREGSDGREQVIRRLSVAELEDADRLAAIADLYGQDVADAFESGGVDAAIAALPEVW